MPGVKPSRMRPAGLSAPGDAPRWMHEMRAHAAAKGKKVDKLCLGYTTCPKCAKAYGRNYLLVFAKVA